MSEGKRIEGMGLPQYKEVGWTVNTLDSLVNMLYKIINGSKRTPKKIEIKIVDGRVEIYVDGKKIRYNRKYIIKIKDFKQYNIINIPIDVSTLQLHQGKITKKSIKERIENIIRDFEREEKKKAIRILNNLEKKHKDRRKKGKNISRNTNNGKEKEEDGLEFGG